MQMPCIHVDKCTGCLACYNVCFHQSIILVENSEGFIVPQIDESKCTKCNLCKNVCPLNSCNTSNTCKLAFAAYSKDDVLRYKSSSGGIFSVISNFVINKGGVIYGAKFNNNYDVEHCRCDNLGDLDKLRGAKYAQSFIGNIFSKVKNDLQNDRIVYFTGTPCQVAGLKTYLKKDYDNLICSDFICHGVPSPIVWKKYLFEKNNSNITNVTFRDKRKGWQNYSMVIQELNNEIVIDRKDNTYMDGFIDNYFLRESCYNCKFKGLDRQGDITLADFWGINEINKDFDKKDEGTSLVLVNSIKGLEIFNQIKNEIIYQEVDVNQAIKYNQSAVKSSYFPIQRKRFFKLIKKNNYENTLKKCVDLSIYERIYIKIKARESR